VSSDEGERKMSIETGIKKVWQYNLMLKDYEMRIKRDCRRKFPGCNETAEGLVQGRYVCRKCLEHGEHKEFKPFG